MGRQVWAVFGGLMAACCLDSPHLVDVVAVWHCRAGSRGLGHAGVVEPSPHLLREGHKVGDAG